MSATKTPPKAPVERRWIDEVEHPASRGRARRSSAGQVIATVVLALAVAWLLNSAAVVRSGEGMNPGVTRNLVLAVGRPVNAFARTVGLTAPRAALDTALGHESFVGSNTALETGSNSILDTPVATPSDSPSAGHHVKPVPPPMYPQDVGGITKVHPPSYARPLTVLVTGDSLATYPGDQLANLAGAKVKVVVKGFNGTGLTKPGFFNWELAAQHLSKDLHPDVVIVVMGANDGWDMIRDGSTLDWATPPWQREYARRVAVVMHTFLDGGADRVYYGGPPTSPDSNYQRIFASINAAVAQAAAATPGARALDFFAATSSHGRYTPSELVNGHRIDARESDGLHWNYDGAVLPATMLLKALEREYGPLSPKQG
jgi:hypothetical protein